MQSLNYKNNEKTHKNVILHTINLDNRKKCYIFAPCLTIKPYRNTVSDKKMCKYGKYLIECFENQKYTHTINCVFETEELAKSYIKLYLQGRKNCTFVVYYAEYYF